MDYDEYSRYLKHIADLIADDNSDKNKFRENAAQEMESNMSNVVNRIVDRNLNIAPTIIIRPGYKFNIIIDKDLILRPYEEEEQ